MSSAGFTFLLFVIGTFFMKPVFISPYSISFEVPYQSGLNAFLCLFLVWFGVCFVLFCTFLVRKQAEDTGHSQFNNDFVIIFFQFLKGFKGSIGVKYTICPGTTLHSLIVIVRDNKTVFMQLRDKCNSLQDLTDLTYRNQHCTQKMSASNIL